MKPECPQCHTDVARLISRSGLIERLLNCFSIHSFRCQLCTHRFRAFMVGAECRTSPSDQRQFERLPTNLRATIVGAQGRSEDLVTDLSMGGCTLQTSTSLSRGTFLHLGLKPSDHEPAILIETAMVRSVRSKGVGLEFLEFDGGQKERLSRFVFRLLMSRQAAAVTG